MPKHAQGEIILTLIKLKNDSLLIMQQLKTEKVC